MKSEIEHSVSQLKWNDTPKFNNNSPSLLWKHDSTVSTDVYLGRVTSIAYLKKKSQYSRFPVELQIHDYILCRVRRTFALNDQSLRGQTPRKWKK